MKVYRIVDGVEVYCGWSTSTKKGVGEYFSYHGMKYKILEIKDDRVIVE